MAYASRCRTKRLLGATEAEEAFKAIMDELGIEYEREKLFFYGNGSRFILADFFVASSRNCGCLGIIFEIDGETNHAKQVGYDKGRDEHFETIGIRTVRFGNRQVLKTPGAVAEKVRREVG